MDAIYALTLTFKYPKLRKCPTLNCCWTFTIWWRWLNAYPTSECIFKHFKFPKRNITLPFCKNTEMNYKKFTNDMALNKNGDINHWCLSCGKVLNQWKNILKTIKYTMYPRKLHQLSGGSELDKLKWSIHFVFSTVGSTTTGCCPQCQQT